MDLKREDLINDCAVCSGSGMVTESSGNSHFRHTHTYTCTNCGGQGFSLTPAGKVLADFIRKVR